MNHSICKQHLHISYNGSEYEAQVLHGKLSAWCRDYLFAALERALDQCAPRDEYWLFEHLEIDAGVIASDRLEQELPALIERALEKSLGAQMPVRTYPESAAEKSFLRQRNSENGRQNSALQRLTSAWMHFLETGTLPWNFKLPEGKNLEQALSESWQQYSSNFDGHTLLPVLADANARKRLVLQFSKPFLATLLERIAPAMQSPLAGILQILEHSDLSAKTVSAFAAELWQTAFALGKQTQTEMIVQAWQSLPAKTMQRERLASILEQHWPGTTAVNPSVTIAKKTDSAADWQAHDNQSPFLERNTLENPIETGDFSSPSTASGQTQQHPDINTGIYIDNAGLVILHPFLPQFFNALGIADGDRLVQPNRALCLLHFLMTGQYSAPEYELVLPKVLCNIPLLSAVEADMTLTQTEREEAEALLQAVIQHWAALKNTGIDGLRGAFLQRAGKIALRDDGDWLLQVENKSYDILLEQLPWGIGTLKLPWMGSLLWVEWMV